jgi:hypothetical protein
MGDIIIMMCVGERRSQGVEEDDGDVERGGPSDLCQEEDGKGGKDEKGHEREREKA